MDLFVLFFPSWSDFFPVAYLRVTFEHLKWRMKKLVDSDGQEEGRWLQGVENMVC